jgi:hypothetical protein
MGWSGTNWIIVAQDMNKWRDSVNTGKNLRVS